MANIFALTDVRNNVHRSGFDLSFRNCFTGKLGQLLPVMCEEVLPGDKWSIDIRQFMRTAPVQTATFGRMRQYYDFYFVPYRLLWDKFPAWITQTKNAYHAKSLIAPVENFAHHPYILLSDVKKFFQSTNQEPSTLPNGDLRYNGCQRLMSYLGYGLQSSYFSGKGGDTQVDYALNPFPLAGYQKIYQDYFRFAQWEDAAPWTYNFDYVLTDSDTRLKIGDLKPVTGDHTLFDLQACNFDKDLFTGLLPAPQFGDTAIAGPISGSFAIENVHIAAGASGDLGNQDAGLFAHVGSDGKRTLGGYVSETGKIAPMVFGADAITGNFQNIGTAGISVLLLRQAECLQKWKEITLSGSPDYVEQLSKHWNVRTSPAESYMCSYLGGIASDIDVSEVINTNLESDDSQAFIAGKGLSASNGHIEFTNPNNDYGLIYCIYHSKPILDWQSVYGTRKLCLKTAATDYAMPEFDQIGMQAVTAGEFLYNAPDAATQVGYAPRYIEYKTAYDQIHGAFANTLKPWVIPYYLDGSTLADDGGLTYLNFKVPIRIADNMFGVAADETVETDHLYNTAYFKCDVVRNLDRNGLPY